MGRDLAELTDILGVRSWSAVIGEGYGAMVGTYLARCVVCVGGPCLKQGRQTQGGCVTHHGLNAGAHRESRYL